MKYQLKKPIEHAGETILELDLKEPNTKLAKQLGMPYSVDAEGAPQVNPQICAAYLSKLAGLPPSVIEKISLPDFNVLCWQILLFFGDQEASKRS